MGINTNHPEAREKLTARLFWKLATERGYVDAGNVKEYADATSRALITRSRTAQGTRHVNAEVPDVNHEAWTFLLDESHPAQERLLRLAREADPITQQRSDEATASIQSVELDRWFEIGSYQLGRVRVSASRSGRLDEGTDFEIDYKNGRIKILEDAIVSAGEDLVISFTRPEMRFEQRISQQQPIFYCDVIIEEYNQFHQLFLRKMKCRAYLNVAEFATQSGEFAAYRVKLTPATAVTILKRDKGETIPEPPEGEPGDESSSSSLSSSSSRSSRSSFSSSSSGDTTPDPQSDGSSSEFLQSSSQSSQSPSSLSSGTSNSSSNSSSESSATITSSTSEGAYESSVDEGVGSGGSGSL